MRCSLRDRGGRSPTWPAMASVVLAVTLLFGCSSDSGTDGGPDSKPEDAKPGDTKPVSRAPAERPAFIDVLAAATPADAPLPPGEPMPELNVEGWMNGKPSKADDDIVVLECWAYW